VFFHFSFKKKRKQPIIMSLKSQLSHLMPVADACTILGEDRVSRIVSSILRLQQHNQQNLNKAMFSKQQQEVMEDLLADETSALVHSMLYTTNAVKPNHKLMDIDSQAAFIEQAMHIKTTNTLPDPTLMPSPSHEQHIPPPIIACWKKFSSRPLLLDKLTFFKFLVPSSAQPHAGPGGHSGLFDCLMYALQSKPFSASPTSSSSGGLNPPPVLSIPDICIFLAIGYQYWNLHTQNDPEVIVSFDQDNPIITVMAKWMFLLYDSYQKSGMITRDTIHRFMSDVYGDDSWKLPPMVDVLDKIFRNPNSPLTSREFVRGIVDTMTYDPLPSHFLLDWMAAFTKAMMPAENTSTTVSLPESAAVFLQTMDRQCRWLPSICDQYHLAEHRLYEIKRRFHSLVESSTTVIQGDPMGDTEASGNNTSREAGNNNSGASTTSLPSGSNGNSGTFPKHVIPAAAFLQKVCSPSDELGHGGYLPQPIADRVFQSVAQFASATPVDDIEPDSEENQDAPKARSYWDLAHVLQYGGMCVRSEDGDEALVKWILQLFCKRGDTALDRSQVKELLICLCEHKDFRNASDRPRWEIIQEDTEINDAENLQDENGEVTVNLRTALQLRLLPDSFAQTEPQTPKISINTLVDHMLKVVKSTDETITKEQLWMWHRNSKQYSQHRLGPLIMELRLIASVMFGVPPKQASMEKLLIAEIQERHLKRYPQTDVSRRGPRGTVWYIIDDKWYSTWSEVILKLSRSNEDGNDLRDKASGNACPRRVTQISNRSLLRDNGSLALRADIKWRHDYEILPPLAWSALQAWYDGGPPIHRTVVPDMYNASGTGATGRRGATTLRTENEIELYPFFVTMFLCDSASRGEARPFQQQVPVSRHSPVRVLLVQLCKGLDIDPDTGRLWVMDASDNEQSGKNDWLLNLDSNIVVQTKGRHTLDGTGIDNMHLLLELKDEETGLWPRGVDGNEWTFKKEDFNGIDVGDGVVGLYNMGNTCYLNSSIQCLSHTPIFRDYFTSKCYLNDINTTNKDGYGGHLAQVTAVLINTLWKRFNQQALHQPKRVIAPQSYAPVNAPALTPKTFKESIGKFDDRFAGNEQHDAQELLTFLLDGLGEEFNRIQDKPYIEHPDSDGRPDSELADIWWSNLLKREMSIIIAVFHGQYKSLLRCKDCKYESARFENFSCLTLPLPEDDDIPVTLIYYPCRPDVDIMRYTVKVHNNGTLYDVLISLAKVIYADEHSAMKEDAEIKGTDREKEKLDDIYKKMSKDMVVVDMRESYIFKIAPNAWRLPDLQNKDTGELPILHVVGLDPIPEDENEGNEDDDEHPAVETDFLAFSQRRSELLSKDLLHPLTHRIFGTPMLLRVADLNGRSNKEVYDLVANHLPPYVPQGAHKFLVESNSARAEDKANKINPSDKTKAEIRRILPKTLSDAEEVSAGPVPRYGFRLRITSRDGRRCGQCAWYDCCIGCTVPDDENPTVLSNGDSLAIDWHFAVDVATSGFGTRASQDPLAIGGVSRSRIAGIQIKNHISCANDPKKKGHAAAITLEDCLDEFAKEEKMPEVYCSKCKDYKMQTKRMSLWRLPPVVIIHLKRFQFTQHMRRKLRDFVDFPLEGLDLSRIMARDVTVSTPKIVDNSVKETIPADCETKKNGESSGSHDKTREDTAGDGERNGDSAGIEDGSSRMNDDDGRSEMLYDLYGVVHHQGALSTGHYVASLKSEIDGQWRLFNDAQIFEIHPKDVVDSSAYLLFYIRRDVASQKLSDFWDIRKRDGEGISEEEIDSLIRGRSDRCVIS
jgi:ubiquitin C-terminal hydrolase